MPGELCLQWQSAPSRLDLTSRIHRLPRCPCSRECRSCRTLMQMPAGLFPGRRARLLHCSTRGSARQYSWRRTVAEIPSRADAEGVDGDGQGDLIEPRTLVGNARVRVDIAADPEPGGGEIEACFTAGTWQRLRRLLR